MITTRNGADLRRRRPTATQTPQRPRTTTTPPENTWARGSEPLDSKPRGSELRGLELRSLELRGSEQGQRLGHLGRGDQVALAGIHQLRPAVIAPCQTVSSHQRLQSISQP